MSRFIFYFLLSLILGLAVAFRLISQQPVKIPRDQQVTLVATIKSQPRIYERSAVLAVGDAWVYVPLYPGYKVGDRVRIEGFVDSDGKMFNARVEKLGEELGLGKLVGELRERVDSNIKQFLPAREAALTSGMVLGIDSIDREFRDQLINTGTIHVVVVSGQNLAIVAGLFLSLTKVIGRRLSLVLATAAVFLYALLTGFEPPVVRASLMVLFSSIAIYYGRQAMAFWSLILAALVILFFTPRALAEVSFQLTFAATLGIITLGRWISGIFARGSVSSFQKLLVDNAAIATSAYLFTAPIILLTFGRISPVAPLVNILVAELVFPIMALGFLIAGASLVWSPLAQILAYFAYVPAAVFVKVVEAFSKLT